MKKRILALALAGTTAFSVFGAAMSANAASTHVVYGNDPYISYKSATVTFDAATNTYENEYTGNVIDATKYNGLFNSATDLAKATLGTTNGTIVGNTDNARKYFGFIHLPDVTATVYPKSVSGETIYVASPVDGATGVNFATAWGSSATPKVFTSKADEGTAYEGKLYNANEVLAAATASIASSTDPLWVDQLKANYSPANTGNVIINAVINATKKVYGDGALVTSELSRNGVTVENGNFYAADYAVNPVLLQDYWDDAEFIRKKDTNGVYNGILVSTNDVYTAGAYDLTQLLATFDSGDDKNISEIDAIGGTGTVYSARRVVIEEFEEFLVEIGLAEYNRNGTALTLVDINGDGLFNAKDKADFLTAYSYKYSGNDAYNFTGLVSDLFDAVDYGINNAWSYENYSSSHIVYLMQQYDKYVDGSYVEEEEADAESRWAELLISAIEAVDSTNFKSGYTAFKRAADNAIEDYEDATTPIARARAIQELYDVATSSFGTTSSANKTDLVASLESLYFNNKNVPAKYLTIYDRNSANSDLTLYTYGAVKLSANSLDGTAKVDAVKTVYPLYPMNDFVDYDTTTPNAVYTGNKTDADFAGKLATGDYEWFWNVYQLATTINTKANNTSYQGIIDTVNDALNAAVADLAVVTTPAGSATTRLDEAVEKYADKVESDYVAKYFNAYSEAYEFADEAVGKYQTLYAIEMVETTGQALGYQNTQATVTKGMIADLKTAIKNAETALKALKADKEQYNAAQAVALTNAIDNANKYVKLYDGTYSTSELYQSVNKGYSKLVGDKDQMVISDVTKAIEDINAAIEFKNVIQGWSKNEAGKWQYGETDGYVQSGWKKLDSVWYYFEDGAALQSAWKQIDGKWYWFNSNCGAAYGWAKVDGQWYYFGGDNAMKTGWVKVDGNWYYLASSGRMITGWAQVDGKWYYMSKESNSLGQMLANTTTPDGYKVGADGAMLTK